MSCIGKTLGVGGALVLQSGLHKLTGPIQCLNTHKTGCWYVKECQHDRPLNRTAYGVHAAPATCTQKRQITWSIMRQAEEGIGAHYLLYFTRATHKRSLPGLQPVEERARFRSQDQNQIEPVAAIQKFRKEGRVCAVCFRTTK